MVRISRVSLDSFSFSFSAFFDAAEPVPGPGRDGRDDLPFADDEESMLPLRDEPDEEGETDEVLVVLNELRVVFPLADEEDEDPLVDVEALVDDPSSSKSHVVIEKLNTESLVIACLIPAAVMALCLMSMVCIMHPSLVSTRSTREDSPTSPMRRAFRFKVCSVGRFASKTVIKPCMWSQGRRGTTPETPAPVLT